MAEPARIIKNRFVKDRQQLRQNYLGPDIKASYQRELDMGDPRLHNVLLQKFRAIKMPEAVMLVLNSKVNDATKITQIRDICLNHMYANMGFTKRKYNSQEVNQMVTYISSILFGYLRKTGKVSQIPEFWKNHLRFINKQIGQTGNVPEKPVAKQPIPKVTPIRKPTPGATTQEPGLTQGRQQLVDTLKAREDDLRQQAAQQLQVQPKNKFVPKYVTPNFVYVPTYETPTTKKPGVSLSEDEIRRRNMVAEPLFEEPEANVTKPVNGLTQARKNMLNVLDARKKSLGTDEIKRNALPRREFDLELQKQFIFELDNAIKQNIVSQEFKDAVLKYLGQLIKDKKFDRVELYIERVRKQIKDVKARIELKQKSRLNETRIAFKKELDRLEKESLLDEDTKKTILENFEDLAKENNQETIDDYIVDILHELESRSPNVANNVLKYTIDRFIKDLKKVSVKRFTTQDLEKINYLTRVYDDYLDFAVNSKMIPLERKQQMQIFFARQLQNKNFDQIEKLLQNILSKVKLIIKESIEPNLTTKGVLEAITTTRGPQLPNLSQKKYTESIPNYPEQKNEPVGEHEQIVHITRRELYEREQKLRTDFESKLSELVSKNIISTDLVRDTIIPTFLEILKQKGLIDATKYVEDILKYYDIKYYSHSLSKEQLLKVYSEYLDLQNKYSDERKKQLLDYVEKQIDARGVDSEEEILRRLIPANFWAAERVYVPTYVSPKKQEERQIKPVDVERNRSAKPYFDENEFLRPVRKIIPKKEYTDILSFAKEHIGVFRVNNKLEEVKILTEYSRLLDQAIKIGMIDFEIAKSEFMDLVFEFSTQGESKIGAPNSLIRFKKAIQVKMGFVDLETKLNMTLDALSKFITLTDEQKRILISSFNRFKESFDYKSASKLVEQYTDALNRHQKKSSTEPAKQTESNLSKEQLKRSQLVRSKFGAEFRRLGLSEIEIKGVFDEYKRLLNEVDEESAEEYLVNYLNGLTNSSKQRNDFRFYDGAKKPNILGASDIKDIISRQLESLRENKKSPEIMFDPLKVKELEASYSQYLDYAIANGIIKPEMRKQLFNAFKLFVKKDTAKIERMLWDILRKLPDKVVTLQSKPIERVQTDNSEPEQLDLFRKKSPKVKGIDSLSKDIARTKRDASDELRDTIKRNSIIADSRSGKGKDLAVISDPQLDLFYGPKVKYGPGKNGVFVKNTRPARIKSKLKEPSEKPRMTMEDAIAKVVSKRQKENVKKIRLAFANRLRDLYVRKLLESEQIGQLLERFDIVLNSDGIDAANDYVIDVLHELESKGLQRNNKTRTPNVPVAPEIQQVVDQLNKKYDEYTKLYNKFFADLEARKEPEVLNKQEIELSNKLKKLFEEYITSAINYRLLTPEKRDQLQRFFNSQLERRNFKTLNKVLSGLIESIYERYTRKIDADDLKNKSRTSRKQKLKRSMTKKDIDTIKLNDSVSELQRKRRAQNIEDFAKETSARTAGLVLPGDGKPTTIITGQETNPGAKLIMPKKLEPKEIITNTRFGKGQRTESHSKKMKKLGPGNRYATITNKDKGWFEASSKSDLGVVLPEEYDGTINPELTQNESDRAILIRLARKANQDDLMGSLLDKLAEEHLVRIDGKLRYAKDPDSVKQIEDEYTRRVIVKNALEELGKRIGNWEEGVNPIDINKFVFASVLNLEKANIAPDGTIIGLDLGSFGFRRENGKLIILNKVSKRQILEIPESNQDGIFVGTNKSVYEYRTGPFGFGKSAESNPTFFLEDNNDVRFVILRKKGKLRLYYLPALK